VLADDGSGKAHASLNDDPRLLGVHRDWPAAAGDADPPTKRCVEQRGLPGEMVREAVPTAGMPEVARDKAVATSRTTPE
jgi:hypothetical protein